MDYLQYYIGGFKYGIKEFSYVLNLIINGLPSILMQEYGYIEDDDSTF